MRLKALYQTTVRECLLTSSAFTCSLRERASARLSEHSCVCSIRDNLHLFLRRPRAFGSPLSACTL